MNTYQQQQEQAANLETAVNTIRTKDDFLYSRYKKIKADEEAPLQAYEGFKAAADAMIQEVQAMQGAVYTPEGKNALIRERLNELAEAYKEQDVKTARELRETVERMNQHINDKINATTYTAAEETRLKMQDLEAETRSALAFAKHQREVEGIMRDLVKRGERDRDAARFASKYAYIFAERASALADDHDRKASLHTLRTLSGQAEQLAYREIDRARLTILESIKKKEFSTGGPCKRLIDMNRDTLLKKYK